MAVSIAAGVGAITSAFADLRPFRVALCLVAVGFMMVANLRGVRESGALFAPPTYIYIFALAALVIYGLYQTFFQDSARSPAKRTNSPS